jgi:tetratricopeptide (TPR) repeat protein
MTRARLGGAFLLALAALGCASNEGIVRVVDGRAVHGAYVPGEAYAAYLRGAIAEAGGDLAGAVEGYSIAVALGPSDPDPWARLGGAECARQPRDPKADEAFEHAFAIDREYAPAWAAQAQCAARRGDARAAAESAKRAVEQDASDAGPLALLADGERGPSTDALRATLVALTLVHGSDVVAWDALAGWARRRGDAVLEARALARVAALAPSRGAEVDGMVARFVGEGAMVAARSLARARMESLQGASVDPRVARLAIDDALAAGDADRAKRLATRAHVPLPVVAARCLLAGDASTARTIAAEITAADPRSTSAALVLAVAADALGDAPLVTRSLATPDATGKPDAAPIAPEIWLVYARAIARAGTGDAALAVLRGLPRAPILAGDPALTPVAVALAARGALDPSDLDANGRIELAERRGDAVADPGARTADARHTLLALARRAPGDAATKSLAARLAPARSEDAVVAVAFARLALASDAGSVARAAAVLDRFDPADPLVASAALDCAVRSGDARAIPLARRRLAAVARTPAERARVVD